VNILIVDDQEENLYFLRVLLGGSGHRTVEAANGKTALEALERERFDLVISDLLMPVMDGYQLCRRIRADERWRRLPFIFYTATYVDQKDEEFALTLGADRFFRKPLDPKALLANIQQLLAEAGPAGDGRPLAPPDETEVLKLYSERLVHKLEEKMAALESETAQRKQAEAALGESERKYRLIAEHTADVVTVLDMDLRITYVNPAILHLRGFRPEEVVGRSLELAIAPDSFRLVREAMAEEMALEAAGGTDPGRSRTLVLEERHKDGASVWTEVNLAFLRDESNRPIGIVSVSRDITARKRAEERLQASLAEKEALLREVHHRVKNNLQLVSSLVNFSARGMKEPAGREALTEIRLRIRAIAMVHDKLYKSPDLARVELGEFLSDLLVHYSQVYAAAGDRIAIMTDLEKIGLPIETAVPVGLIAGELIGNSLRHAFPAGRAGRLTVELRRLPEGQVLLAVGDDGPGLPEDIDPGKSASLGFVIVKSLADQIGGRIELDRKEGTTFRIVFPAPGA